jgi:hypothetical protein
VTVPLIASRRAKPGFGGATAVTRTRDGNYGAVVTPSPEPVVQPQDIHWAVRVTPSSFTQWTPLRKEVVESGHFILGEDDRSLEIGARDEGDATSVLELLREKGLIRTGETRHLGRLRRWRIRQALMGNYGGTPDPSQPYFLP